MLIGLTGSTGLIGRALTRYLLENGHKVRAFGRSDPGDVPFVRWDLEETLGDPAQLAGLDAFVNLAGEPLAEGRWTPERKQRMRTSRVEGTRNVVEALSGLASGRPGTLINASAVGYYGDRNEEILDEESPPGTGFLPDLCRDWESEGLAARNSGIRVVMVRTGIVLAREGGALPKMLTPFRLGIGGRLGSGRQYFPWIHLVDEVRLIEFALLHRDIEGPLNVTSPNPVTNARFTRELAGALRRPAILPVPRFSLRLLFGEMANTLLEGQRAMPRKALEMGFAFRYPTLRDALADLLG
jgi:uncharacterized protein